MTKTDKDFYSVPEVAKLMRVSRIAVYKKIKSGQINAQKVGRNYIVSKLSVGEALGTTVSQDQKTEIERAVKKAIREYGTTFRRLGKEE